MKTSGKLHDGACAAAVCIVLTSVALSAAQALPSLTLTDAAAAALANHSSVRTANLGIELARARITEKRAEWLPAIAISETVARSNNPVFAFGSLLEQARFGPQNFAIPSLNNPQPLTNLRTSITATIPAFDGFRTAARVEQAQRALNRAELMKQTVEQRVRFETVREYLGLLVAEAARDAADEALEMAEADMDRARARLDAGLSVQSDLLGAQLQLAEFRQQRIKAAGEVITARARLNLKMGVPADSVYTLAMTLAPARFQIEPQQDLLRIALARRADYTATESAVTAAERNIAENRSEYLPQLKIFGTLGSSGRSLSTGSGDYAIGATVSINIIDRGRASRLDQARIGKDFADVERGRMADQVRLEVITAYQNFLAAEEQTGVAETSLAQATEALRIIRDRYTAGLNTITDLLRAETAVVRGRLNVVECRHAYYVGYANLLLSAGLLSDVDGVSQRGGNDE